MQHTRNARAPCARFSPRTLPPARGLCSRRRARAGLWSARTPAWACRSRPSRVARLPGPFQALPLPARGDGTGGGGDIQITGKAGSGVGGNGGNIIIRAGHASTATPGAVEIKSLDGTSLPTPIRFYDNDDSNYVAIKAAAAITSDITWTLPDADGDDGNALVTDGAGGLSFAQPTIRPAYEKVVIAGSPVILTDDVFLNIEVEPTTGGSPFLVALGHTSTLQVFRNGLLQEEDLDGGSPIAGDFIVTGENQLTFAPGLLQPGDVIIVYSFIPQKISI